MTKRATPKLPVTTIRQPMAIRRSSFVILSPLGPGQSSFAAAVMLLMFLSASGCGSSSKLEITGKLTKKGQPYQPPPMTLVTLTFISEKKDSEQTYVASYDREKGTYAVELPPGQYKTSLFMADRSKRPTVMQKAPPAFGKTVYDLTSSKTLDLDVDP